MTQSQGLRIAVTVGALCLTVVHLWKPELRIDSITLVLIVMAVLPWVQPLVKSIELLGVKLELQELRSELADAKGAAESATRKADFLLSETPMTTLVKSSDAEPTKVSDNTIQQLMQEYDRIRATQSAGSARTVAMTGVMKRMIALAANLSDVDVTNDLMSTERGRRLAAYAYLYTRPDFRFLAPLVTSVTRAEDKPFGQYWGLQAILRVLGVREGAGMPPDVLRDLRQYAERVPRGSDREYELRKILKELGPREPGD